MEAISGLFTSLATMLSQAAFAIALFAFVIGAIIITLAHGNPRQMEHGKAAITCAAAGFVLVLMARAILSAVQSAVGGG
jgi:hypothetical protein